MKTKKQVISENEDKKTLINAVINRIGIESVMDVVNGGADAGFPGFTYYVDTHKFALRHRKDIVKWLEQEADELGEDVVNMVSHFGVFKNSVMDKDDRYDLYKYISGAKVEQGTITNVMAWFALEEVCRLFDE
jgi:hypothetical protein